MKDPATLPKEILQEILLRSVPAFSWSRSRHYTRAVLKLCAVSLIWRKTAHNLPALWSSIHICMPPCKNNYLYRIHRGRWQEKSDVAWAFISEWLSRSGSVLPLSVSFSTPDRDYSNCQTCQQEHSARMAEVLFESYENRIACLILESQFVKLITRPLPSLDSLILSFDGLRYFVPRIPNIFLSHVKTLKKITLAGCSLASHYDRIEPNRLILNDASPSPGQTLTHIFTPIHLDNVRDQRPWLEFFKNCPGLQNCILEFHRHVTPYHPLRPSTAQDVCIRHLTSLTILNAYEICITEFFDKLYTPALESLRYVGRLQEGETLPKNLLRSTHLSQQVANLRRLSLLYTLGRDLGIISSLFLRHTPLLEELEVQATLLGMVSRGQYVDRLSDLLNGAADAEHYFRLEASENRLEPSVVLFPTFPASRRSRKAPKSLTKKIRTNFLAAERSPSSLPELRYISLDFGGRNRLDPYVQDGTLRNALRMLILSRGWNLPPGPSESRTVRRGIDFYIPCEKPCRDIATIDIHGLHIKTDGMRSFATSRWETRLSSEEQKDLEGLGLPSET